MSVYDDRRRELEEYEFRMGLERGRLAVTLDLLTDAMVLVGQHGVYCQSAAQAAGEARHGRSVDRPLTGGRERTHRQRNGGAQEKEELAGLQKRIPLFFAPDRGIWPMPRHHDCRFGQRQ